MANLEDEINDLRAKNSELVKVVQYWKMTAAERENEKLELMREINELRLQLSRLRNGGTSQARKLDAALQSASEEALSHLVQASGAVARTIELAKSYMRERQELDSASPRWSAISGTPAREKVHRVPPLMVGGHSIQPVVSLSRINTSLSRSITSVNQSHNTSDSRAVPLHMLQDVYIPLTRIDTADLLVNEPESDSEDDLEGNEEDLGLRDNADRINEESPNVTNAFETSRRLDAVAEDMEPSEDEVENTPGRVSTRTDNALEGPSWLLDIPPRQESRPKNKVCLEPDSTTELYSNQDSPMLDASQRPNENAAPPGPASEFSPTVRRRKRGSSPPQEYSPHFSPRPLQRRTSHSGRILKVLVAKLRLSDELARAPPAKRPGRGASPRRSLEHAFMGFDAPSPNGATDAGVIVMDSSPITDHHSSVEPVATEANNVNITRRERASHDIRPPRDTSQVSRDSREDVIDIDTETIHDRESHHDESHQENRDARQIRNDSRQERLDIRAGSVRSNDGRDSCQSDSSSYSDQATEGRARRPRKNVVYKEKPLNRKMRR